MQTLSSTEHYLEIRNDNHRDRVFLPALAGMYQEARELVCFGRIEEALRKAGDIHIKNYGDMHGVTFRVVSRHTTYSVLGSYESAGLTG